MELRQTLSGNDRMATMEYESVVNVKSLRNQLASHAAILGLVA